MKAELTVLVAAVLESKVEAWANGQHGGSDDGCEDGDRYKCAHLRCDMSRPTSCGGGIWLTFD